LGNKPERRIAQTVVGIHLVRQTGGEGGERNMDQVIKLCIKTFKDNEAEKKF
jgi:hypothetical protein